MPEPRSALASVYQPGTFGAASGRDSVTIFERSNRGLLQVSSWPDSFASVACRLASILDCAVPADGTLAVSHGDLVVFRVGPERLWLAGTLGAPVQDSLSPDEATMIDLGHSQTVLRIAGPGARVLFSRGLPIDLDEIAFAANAFVQSVIHHIPVLVHRLDAADEVAFDVYVSSDFTVSFWDWLITAAAPLGGQVEDPR